MARGLGLSGFLVAAAAVSSCHSGIQPVLRPTAPPPSTARRHLAARRFLAFGDSLTEGAATPSASNDAAHDRSYPAKLLAMLEGEYTTDEPVVVNGGRGGEQAAQAGPRLAALLDADHPDVVMLMDGVNDLSQDPDVSHALAAVRALVTVAEAHGAKVIVATLPPERRGGSRASTIDLLPAFDAGVIHLSEELRLPLANVYEAMTVDMVAPDGLHLLESGNDRIAQVFFDTITHAFVK